MTETTVDPAAIRFHVDKRIPIVQIITFTVALFLQAMGIAWYIRGLQGSVDQIDYRLTVAESRVDAMATQGEPLRIEIARLNGNLERLVTAIQDGRERDRELDGRVRDLERRAVRSLPYISQSGQE